MAWCQKTDCKNLRECGGHTAKCVHSPLFLTWLPCPVIAKRKDGAGPKSGLVFTTAPSFYCWLQQGCKSPEKGVRGDRQAIPLVRHRSFLLSLCTSWAQVLGIEGLHVGKKMFIKCWNHFWKYQILHSIIWGITFSNIVVFLGLSYIGQCFFNWKK
jgi:hypothetical protein